MSPEIREVVARQARLDAVLRPLRPRVCSLPRAQARMATTCWRLLDVHAPLEVDAARAPLVHALAGIPWIRAPDRWRGADLRSLVAFLGVGVRYDLPAFLWDEVLTSRQPPVALLAFLGGGGAVRDAARAGLLPILTRREGHQWWTGSGEGDAVARARRAQVAGAGGPGWLADLMVASFLGAVTRDEARWRQVVVWLARSADALRHDAVPHLLDFLRWHPDLPGRRTVRAACWTLAGRCTSCCTGSSC